MGRNLKEQFTQEMRYLCGRIKDETRLPFPSRFNQMINEKDDGVEAVQRLIYKPGNTDTFANLLIEGRKDLTVEHAILQPKWGMSQQLLKS